jgi:hypothetical protein
MITEDRTAKPDEQVHAGNNSFEGVVCGHSGREFASPGAY